MEEQNLDIIAKYRKLQRYIKTEAKIVSTTYHPDPIEEDFQIGYLDRFFLRKANQQTGIIQEVDAKTYKKFMNNPLFAKTRIRWKIMGPLNTTFNDDGSVKEYGIAHANKRSIELGKKDISNLDKFLVDYTKFYKG